MRSLLLFIVAFLFSNISGAQDTANYRGMTVNLDEVVVQAKRVGFDVNSFIKRVETDTTFYRAFRNLHLLGYSADNDIRIYGKKGKIDAFLKSQTLQTMEGTCRTMKVLHEETGGDFYTSKGDYKYYTAELYANFFFTKGTVCAKANGESNEPAKGNLAKHKAQLKQLIFNPGQPIKGVPIVGGKVAIFDPEVMRLYNFSITSEDFNGVPCWVFSATAKKDLGYFDKNDIVINEMITYFTKDAFDIVNRKYSLSYKTLVFDFNVKMNVQLVKKQDLLTPTLVTYEGTWDVPFRKRETAIFIAKFHEFTR